MTIDWNELAKKISKKEPARNDPCWCGSGRKFKYCHKNRSTQEPNTRWEAMEKSKRAFNRKKCCAPVQLQEFCQGKIVKAHTVSRGANLAKIARDGKVIGYKLNVADLEKNNGTLKASLIGIKNASIFYGFCSEHDRVLFSCIENEQFVGRPDQCLTIAFRTISRELYGKEASGQLQEIIGQSDKGKSFLDQIAIQQIADLIGTGVTSAQNEQRATYEELANAIVNENYDILSNVIFKFDNQLPIMFAGGWTPFADFYDNKLQDSHKDTIAQQIFFSSFATDRGGYICVSWINKKNAPGKAIIDQITSLPNDQQTSAIFQFVLKHVENIFFSPEWFENLPPIELVQIEKLANYGINYLDDIANQPLNVDLNFQLPHPIEILEQ